MTFSEFVGFLKNLVELAETARLTEDNKTERGIPSTEGVVNQYENLARAKDRDTLLRLCGEKNIPVPPRTATPVLAQMLTEHDAKMTGQTNTSESTSSNPFDDDDTAGVDAAVTVEMIRDALAKVHETKGLAAVMAILNKQGGGVEKIKEILPENYAAVYTEAIK